MTAPQSPAPAQSLLDEIAAVLDKWMSLSTNPQISAETYWGARPGLEQESRTALSRYRAAKAAEPNLVAAALVIDRLSLVIESAVRNADPDYYGDALTALRINRAALAAAQAKEGRDE